MKQALTLPLFVIVSVGVLITVGIILFVNKRQRLQTVAQQQPTKQELAELETAIFAGGCFWCVESDFEKLNGVVEAISGYSGGTQQNPTYQDHGDHLEAVRVYYDPQQITYEELVRDFFKHIDPTDDGGQFVDRGHSYTTAVFYTTEAEQQVAEEIKTELDDSQRFESEIVTPILPATEFYDAEDYHQNYYKKNPVRYNFYRSQSGRDDFIQQHWEQD